ncbi:Dirigent protein 8 [Spatholobus suberectus]|nr:Dirigent protein 8 [Spatholobus suberectus]
MDDPLIVRLELDSELVGKAKGIYTSILQEEMALMMVMTMAFTNGEFNSSTISMLVRNMIMSETVREMAIVGSTKAFWFTHWWCHAAPNCIRVWRHCGRQRWMRGNDKGIRKGRGRARCSHGLWL